MKRNLLMTWLIALLTMLGVSTVWAAEPDLENDYTLVKSVTWDGTVDIEASGACDYTAYDTGNSKQQTLTVLTAPTDAAGWIAMQQWVGSSSTKGWRNTSNGLFCKSAARSACVFGDDLTTGWLVVFECTQTVSNVMTLTNKEGAPDGTFNYAKSEDGKTYFCTITAAENAHVGFCGIKEKGNISKISVYKPNKAVVQTTYQVNYVDMDGNTLKESNTYDAIGGTDVNLTDADKDNITIGDDTYVYDSDDAEGKQVAEDGSTVITVKFHKAQNFNYTVYEMCGGTVARATNGFSYETAEVIAPYRKYNAVEGQLYTKGATNKEYNYKFTLTQDNQEERLEYTAVDGVNNVVFLTEGEDVAGLTACNSANTGIRSSNSASGYAKNDTKIAVLAPGTYKLHAIIYDSSKNPDSHWVFKAGDTQVADFNCTTVNIQEFDSEEFTVSETCHLIMPAAGNNNMGLDALYITGSGEVTAIEDVYTVAGTKDLTGYVWDERQNEMSYDAETGLYTWTAENITVTAEVQPEFKVVKNGTEWYPAQDETGDNNWVITPDVVGGEGIYTITITFDPNAESDKISVTGVKTGEITIYIYTAKFINTKDWSKVCVWAWNGSVNLYEAWPGVEATKTEEQVDGHDVYAWSYTGVIEPTMIIFNNGDNGEQTGDLEFVNGATYNADGIVPAGPTVATFNFADPNFRENIGEAMTDTKGYIYNETFYAEGASLQITAGSAPSRIYVDNSRGQCLVTYKEYTTLTFKAPLGKAITKIEFTAAGNSNIKNFTASSGAIEGMTWTGDAEGVRFQQGGTSYLANAIVTMEPVGENTVGFGAIEYTSCANIGEFNALEAGTYATVTLTDAEVIGKSADGYSTVWIQDATGGCWIQYTSLNDLLQEKTKVNGFVNVVKRDASGNPQMKEAENTANPQLYAEAISNYTTVKGSIGEVNVKENLDKVVKISGADLTMTSATAGTLTQGDVTIDVNNGTATANQQLCKIADWEKDTKLENIVITAILVAKSATVNQLLPISIQPVHTDYYLVGSMSSWSPNKDYTLVINDKADAEEYMITCNLEEGTEMKVARSENGTTIADTDWYPTGVNNNYYISETANYTVYFRPNYDGGDNWHERVIYAVNNGSATGINAITAEKLQNAVIYNLNGQRVQNAQKGLYIVNGKKAVVK